MKTHLNLLGVFAIAATLAGRISAEEIDSNILPNGSFEFWDQYGEFGIENRKQGLWTENPDIPKRWEVHLRNPSSLSTSSVCHSGKSALAISAHRHGVPCGLQISGFEAIPTASYSFGFWLKGKGKAVMAIYGFAAEGFQKLASVEAEAKDEWTEAKSSIQIPKHIRSLRVSITVPSESNLLIDDAFLSAKLKIVYDADAVLGKKYVKDEHTLFFEDFDGASPHFIPTCKEIRVTEDNGGRFGKGLRLDRKGSATIPLTIGEIPPEGTFECWVSPDNRGGFTYAGINGEKPLIAFHNWQWAMSAAPGYDGWNSSFYRDMFGLQGISEIDVFRTKKGLWHHLAYTWDKSTVRFYIDGVMTDMKTSKELKWPDKFSFIQLGQAQKYDDITVDEIRISNIRRYGPLIPDGHEYSTPLTIPKISDKSELSGTSKPNEKTPPSPEKIAEERKKMIETIPPTEPGLYEDNPNSAGNYVYESTSAKPLVTGSKCELESDKVAKGLTIVKANQASCVLPPDLMNNEGIYWTLKNIKKRPYWIGVTYSGDGATGGNSPMCIYLNGRIVQIGSQSNPKLLHPNGLWFVEAFSAESEELAPGDEIALALAMRSPSVARIILYSEKPQEPSMSPWKYPVNFAGNQWNLYTALGVNVEGKFKDKEGKEPRYLSSIDQLAPSIGMLKDENGKVNFSAYIANPLPIPITVDYKCLIKSFYGDTVVSDKETLTIQPHDKIERKLQFDWQEGVLTYFAYMTLLENDPPDLSKPRNKGGLGWPEYEKLQFFPGHRQILPWPDPFNNRVVRRITISEPYGGKRRAYWLDGNDWEIAYTPELQPPMPPPSDLKFDKASVPRGWTWPRYDDIKPRPHGAYFRKTINLPDDISGRSYKFFLENAYDEATAYVNGIKVGNVRGDHTPILCDMTKALKPGKNEIVIVVRDIIAIMNPAYVNKEAPVGNHLYLDAPGLHGQFAVGIGSVKIISAPLVSAEDVFVVTSVREKKISAKITAATRGVKDVDITIKAEVFDDGKTIIELGGKQLSLKPDQPVEFTLEKEWKKPILWEPSNPHLYSVNVTTTDAKTGEILDLCRERFGFRESWIDGPNIMFNGYPIKPVGRGALSRFSPRGNFNFARAGGRDCYDELGILTYMYIGGVYNSPSQFNVENDLYWKTASENAIKGLKTKQNSPHIIAWDYSNEWLCFFYGDAALGARRFKDLSDHIRAYDPSRWTLANAEGDLNGLLDNYSFHYMEPYFGAGLYEYAMKGHTPYYPDEYFWRPLDRHLAEGEEITKSPLHPIKLRPDLKVIMDTEFLWKCGNYFMPPGPTRFVGENDVLSPAVDSSSGPIVWMWKTMLDGHRDMGISQTGSYSYHPGLQRGAYLEQTFIIPENQHHAYGGTKETRRFTIVNSLFRPHKMTLKWKLLAPDGDEEDDDEVSFKMNSGDIQRGEFSFTLPKVKQKETYTLNVTLESDGDFVCGEEWDIEVFPALKKGFGTVAGLDGQKLERKLLLYDLQGMTEKALKALNLEYEPIKSFDNIPGNPSETTVIIGEDAIDQYSAPITASLANFVERGGKVLVLAQKAAPANLPVETTLDPRRWSSQVFVRAGSHPIISGEFGPSGKSQISNFQFPISSYDLHFWQPDRSVGTGAYKKPFSGSFISIIDTSFWEEMNWTQLMEAFRGKGSYLLCQLPLASRHDVEPMALELLARTIRYSCAKEIYSSPVKTLHAVTSPGSETARILEKMQIKNTVLPLDAAIDPGSPILMDADFARSATPEQKSKWASILNSGARILVINAEPQDNEWISGLAGSKVGLGIPPYPLWDGRAFRKGWSKYTAGISHPDLYWKRYSGAESDSSQAEMLNNIIEPIQYYSASAEKGRELIFPGALVEIPVGKGTLLLDQRRWTAKDERLAKLAMRNVSALMTGLDVEMSSFIEPRPLPGELFTRTVDISGLANYSLKSSPENRSMLDLQGFPEEKSSFLNIPFMLGKSPKGGIALCSSLDPTLGNQPKEVAIPLGYLAEGIYFLHASAGAWDGIVANYRILYEDGTIHDIPLKHDLNISDWNQIRRLPRADIAWTGSCTEYPMIGVQRMLWVNHKPETPIKEIVFSNPEMKAFPVLIGITVAARRETIPVAPGSVAKALTLLEAGKKAFQENKLDESCRMLRDAVVTDPSLKDAYQALADSVERKGNEDLIFDAYRLWTISGPRLPLPWNRVGEILENRGDKRNALDAYKTSLKIEWNQPPTMNAVKRLEESK